MSWHKLEGVQTGKSQVGGLQGHTLSQSSDPTHDRQFQRITAVRCQIALSMSPNGSKGNHKGKYHLEPFLRVFESDVIN